MATALEMPIGLLSLGEWEFETYASLVAL